MNIDSPEYRAMRHRLVRVQTLHEISDLLVQSPYARDPAVERFLRELADARNDLRTDGIPESLRRAHL